MVNEVCSLSVAEACGDKGTMSREQYRLDDDRDREAMFRGICPACGEDSELITIDVNGDWPSRWVDVTICCEVEL